jgi:hypothetical protein
MNFLIILVGTGFAMVPLAIMAFIPEMTKSNKWWIRMFSIPHRWNLRAAFLFIMMLMFEITAFSFMCVIIP